MDLHNLLAPAQVTDIRELAKHKEWLSLIRLLEKAESLALTQFQSFTDSNDAYEKRGMLKGVRLIREYFRNIYEETKQNAGAPDNYDGAGYASQSGVSVRTVGNVDWLRAAIESDESKPTKPAY